MIGRTSLRALAAGLLLFATAGAASAATCRDPGGFDKFVADIRREAAARGVPAAGIEQGLAGITFDQAVMRKDHGQGAFRQSFEQFSGRMVPPRLGRAASLMQRHAALLQRIEAQYGVPGAVLIAIWGLETDFGSYLGSFPTIQSLATLAFDCRRTEKFQAELIDSLRILGRGDLSLGEMKGAWAGEIGQTQFMPSSYLKYAVDFDGDGRRDLIRSVPDVLASTANYLKGYGWQRGAGWEPGQPNFEVIREWNKSQVYARTIAYFASRLAGGR